MATTAPRARTVQLPGEPQQPQIDPPEHEQVPGEPESDGAPVADASAEVEALRAQLAQVQAELAKAKQAKTAAPVVLASKGSAQLTERGWTVPESYGAPAKKVG